MTTSAPATPAVPHAAADGEAPADAAADGFTDVMALAIEGSGTGLWDRDVVTGDIRYSPGWKAILGYRADELSDRIEQAYQRVHPDDLPYVQATMQAHFDGQTPTYEVEHRLHCKDGTWKWVLSRGRVVARDAAGRALRMVGTTTDITATRSLADRLRRAEEELRAQREQLVQAQKMEAVGQLTGGLAHDFNNILGGIMGSLDLVQSRLAQGRLEELDRFVTAAQQETERAAALTRRLLTFARRQTLDPHTIDPNRLVAGIEGLLQRLVGPEIRVATALAEDAWPVLCDAGQLEGAVLNLCLNARDAMPAGGTLTIATRNAPRLAPGGPETPLPAGNYVVISVGDTGTGMTPEVRARAFEPFFSTKPPGQGTGLGLSMVYGFARQSGGAAQIQSDPGGGGTTVRLILPRGVDRPAASDPASRPKPPPRGRGETVLVVDDEPTMRMLVAAAVQDMGCRPLEAADGVAALDVLESGTPVDLLVTDIRMPGGLSGPALVRQARQWRPELKVLFITGYADNETIAAAERGPQTQLLAKPFPIATLTARLAAMLADGRRD